MFLGGRSQALALVLMKHFLGCVVPPLWVSGLGDTLWLAACGYPSLEMRVLSTVPREGLTGQEAFEMARTWLLCTVQLVLQETLLDFLCSHRSLCLYLGLLLGRPHCPLSSRLF